MPNLSKKKGRRRCNPEREVAKAQRILEKHKTEKFLKKQEEQGQSWKYGHLTPKQVMTGSDKLFHSKVIQVSKSRGLADDTNVNEDPRFKSQYNDDRDLTNFVDDQIFRHQVRAMNEASDIDPSDSELENDSDALGNINDNDEIFAVRRKRDQQKASGDEDEVLESSGDDLDRDEDDDLPFKQNVDDTVDIDTQINEMQRDMDAAQAENESDSDTNDAKKHNKRGRRGVKVNMREISQHIMNDNDEESKRLLALSAALHAKDHTRKDRMYDSDGSSYYKSSEDEGGDMERNKYKSNSEEDDEAMIAEEGVGKVSWGKSRRDYYGADGVNKRFKSKSEREQYQELRDEEAIGIQMQKDEWMHQRETDFVDLEMEEMMRQEIGQTVVPSRPLIPHRKGKKLTTEQIAMASEFSSWFNDNNDEAMTVQKEDTIMEEEDGKKSEDMDVGKANIEKIHKDKIGQMQSKIIHRDHPELPGMLKELKQIVSEMKRVFEKRQKAIQKRFDDAIEDSTLFIELLRTYASTICFYLQLKSQQSLDEDKWKKHGIYAVLLKLRHRVSSFRTIYEESIGFMNNLGDDWDRSEYLAQKRELLEYEKGREREVYEERVRKENEKQKGARMQKKKLKKAKKRQHKLKRKLFQKGFNRLGNEDVKLEGEDARRGITQKIFKSQGLKRYRKQGIPRVKARIKFEKKMKLWKRKGFKTFKGKLPNGRMEHNINTGLTHSKRLS